MLAESLILFIVINSLVTIVTSKLSKSQIIANGIMIVVLYLLSI